MEFLPGGNLSEGHHARYLGGQSCQVPPEQVQKETRSAVTLTNTVMYHNNIQPSKLHMYCEIIIARTENFKS